MLFIAAAFAVSAMSVLAIFGFASSWLDLLNHVQPLLLVATAGALALTRAFVPEGTTRAFVLACTATGFVASTVPVVPELLAGLTPRTGTEHGQSVLKLVTHNLFGLNYDMERVASVIGTEDPDIVALQEFFPEQAQSLHPLLIPKYPHFARCLGGKRANIAIYAKLPFEQLMDGACPSDPSPGQRTAHLVARFAPMGGPAFTVVTTHVDWPVPVARQEAQLDALAATIEPLSGPLLVVGDFNSTPWSYALKRLAARTSLQRHTRNLMTYPLRFHYLGGWRETLPFLPLDHVFSRGAISVQDVHAGARTGSDHLPVILTFSVGE